MLYATNTGVLPWADAAAIVRATSPLTSLAQPPIHLATGCDAMRSISAASCGRELRQSSACLFAGELGLTKSFAPTRRLSAEVTLGNSACDDSQATSEAVA